MRKRQMRNWQQGKRRALQEGRASGLPLCGHSCAWQNCHTADHPSHLLLCSPSQLSKGCVRNCPRGTHRAHFSLLFSLCPCMPVPPQAPLGAQEGRERGAQALCPEEPGGHRGGWLGPELGQVHNAGTRPQPVRTGHFGDGAGRWLRAQRSSKSQKWVTKALLWALRGLIQTVARPTSGT